MPRTFAFMHHSEDKAARRAATPAGRLASRDNQAQPDFDTLVADVARAQAATEAAQVETAVPPAEAPAVAGVVDTLVAVLAPLAGEQAPSGSFNRTAARRVPAQRSARAVARPTHGLKPIRTLATPPADPS